MLEVDLQALVVKAIRQAEGFSFKLSNKFLKGIPDLLVCLPGYGTSLWEVKVNQRRRESDVMKVGLSELQYKTLKDYNKGGGIGGVISFVADGSSWLMAAYSVQDVYDNFVEFKHTKLEIGKREQIIVRLIEEAIDGQARRHVPTPGV